MTAGELPRLVCPNCRNANTTVMASGNAACMDCAHMWNPLNDSPTVAPIMTPFEMASVDEVFDTSSHPSNVRAPLDLADDVGGRVVLEGGQEGFVVGIVDVEHIRVILPDDRTEVVRLDDVHAIYAPPAQPPVPDSDAGMDVLAPDLRLALDMARMIIRAGCESVHGTGETIAPGLPPSGYLIDDPDVFPVVEQAAALAVGMLLELLEADVDEVLRAVGATVETDDQGDQLTEVETSEPDPSEDF